MPAGYRRLGRTGTSEEPIYDDCENLIHISQNHIHISPCDCYTKLLPVQLHAKKHFGVLDSMLQLMPSVKQY